MASQKSNWFVLLLSSLALVGLLTACGVRSQSQAPTAINTAQAKATSTPKVEPTATPTKAPATPTPAPAPTNTVAPTETATANTAETLAMTPALPTLPLPNDVQNVEFANTDLTFASPSGIKNLVEFYRQALTSEGWQEDSMLSQVQDSVASIEFKRGEEVISLTLTQAGDTAEAMIDLSEAASLLPKTAEEIPTAVANAPGFTINDWPVAPEATEVKKSGEKLSYKTSLKLAQIAEFYRPTFEKIGLGTSCLDKAISEEYTAVSCSVSDGNFSLSFNAFEGFDQSEVEINFTNYAQGGDTTSSSDESVSGSDAGALTAVDQDGLPLPSDYTNYLSKNSQYSQKLSFSSPSGVTALVEFFQAELPGRGWQLEDNNAAADKATLSFSGAEGNLVVTLTASGSETEVNLVSKNPAAAANAGILPPAGQARLYLANTSAEEITVTVNQQQIKVGPEAGVTSLADAPKIDLSPGDYEVTTPNGVTPVSLGKDEVWVVLLGPGGGFSLQMY